MEAGNIFGWNIPAFDPNMYDQDGKPIRDKVRSLKRKEPA
jgi:hypothetical protein